MTKLPAEVWRHEILFSPGVNGIGIGAQGTIRGIIGGDRGFVLLA